MKEGLSPFPIFLSHFKQHSLAPPLCLGLAEACSTATRSSHLTAPATPGPHMQDTQGNKSLGRINGERGSCGCKKETVVDHLLPLDGKGEQGFLLSQLFSSSSSETAITSLELFLQLLLTASGVGEKMGQGGCAWNLRLISQAAGRRRWP